MKAFRVSLSRIDGASRLHVEGLENANWLLYRLSGLFVFKTSEPLSYIPASSEYKFCVAHSSQISGPSFEKLLAGIGEVKLVLEPAQRVATASNKKFTR